MRWLYRWFFLNKVNWSFFEMVADRLFRRRGTSQYHKCMRYLCRQLTRQLGGPVWYGYLGRQAFLMCDGYMIARVVVFVKTKDDPVTEVEVETTLPTHYLAWFQLAFLGMQVRMRPFGAKPRLVLETSREW